MTTDGGLASRLLEAIHPPSLTEEEEDASSSDPNVGDMEAWCDGAESQLLLLPPDAASRPTFFSPHDAGHDDGSATGARTDPVTPRIVSNELHSSILTALIVAVDSHHSASAPSHRTAHRRCSGYGDDDEAEAATSSIVERVLPEDGISIVLADDGSSSKADSWRTLAVVLRATGLFMRWISQTSSQSSSSSSSPSSSYVGRLKTEGMLSLYARLLGSDIPCTYPDVPRYASICAFRATYGQDESTIKARRSLVNSSKVDGCKHLTRSFLRGDQPIPRLLSVVRNVHHLIATCPEISIPRMERSIEAVATTMTAADDTRGSGLLGALVATMAWACRCDPPFPGSSSNDRRADLVLEILRAMYALDACGRTGPTGDALRHDIGILLCELLRRSSADEGVYEIKLAVVSLLLNATREYGSYLSNNGGIEALVDIMSYQTSVVVVERTNSFADDAAAIVPILLVLLRLVEFDESILKVVKDAVFPPESEIEFDKMASAEIGKGRSEGKVNAKNMAPLDAPSGTLRYRLIRLMTWTESSVKRSACELLWALCDGNATQFVLRTGFGNAIHFLGMKGCVNLPAGVET
jgi:hypothetical protein